MGRGVGGSLWGSRITFAREVLHILSKRRDSSLLKNHDIEASILPLRRKQSNQRLFLVAISSLLLLRESITNRDDAYRQKKYFGGRLTPEQPRMTLRRVYHATASCKTE